MLFSFISIPLILDIICIVHIIKTGKERVWIYIVLFVPVIGSIAYFLTELVPSLFSGRKTREITQAFSNTLLGGKKINELKAVLKISDTYQNRYALAEAYIASGMYDKAIPMFLSCRTGIYADDPHLIQTIASTYILNNEYDNARIYFEMVAIKNQLDKKYRVAYAASLAYHNEFDKAEEIYKELEKENNIEGIYQYAQFLEKKGNLVPAKEKYQFIVFIASTIPRFVYRENKKWIDSTKDALKG